MTSKPIKISSFIELCCSIQRVLTVPIPTLCYSVLFMTSKPIKIKSFIELCCSIQRVLTVPIPTLCYSVLKQIQKSRPLSTCGQPKYVRASEPNLWEVLVSAYSHGLSADTYRRCYQPNTFVSIYLDIDMTPRCQCLQAEQP